MRHALKPKRLHLTIRAVPLKLPAAVPLVTDSITNLIVDSVAVELDVALPARRVIEAAGLTPLNTRGAIGFTWVVGTSPTVMRRGLPASATPSASAPTPPAVPPTARPSIGRGGGEDFEGMQGDDCSRAGTGSDDVPSIDNPYARAMPLTCLPVAEDDDNGNSDRGDGDRVIDVRDRRPLLDDFAGLVLASRLSLAAHPGLLARWRPSARSYALCPCCRRYRHLMSSEHTEWRPDALDKSLCPMPADITEREAALKQTPRASARDCEVLCEDDFDEMLSQIHLENLIKCSCDGTPTAARYIGAPPGRTAAPVAMVSDPLAALDDL